MHQRCAWGINGKTWSCGCSYILDIKASWSAFPKMKILSQDLWSWLYLSYTSRSEVLCKSFWQKHIESGISKSICTKFDLAWYSDKIKGCPIFFAIKLNFTKLSTNVQTLQRQNRTKRDKMSHAVAPSISSVCSDEPLPFLSNKAQISSCCSGEISPGGNS